MKKTSPTPWTSEERSACIAIIDADGKEVLFLMLHGPGGHQNGSITARGRTDGEIRANAALIVQAAALHEALNWYVIFEGHAEEAGDIEPGSGRARALARARAAIRGGK